MTGGDSLEGSEWLASLGVHDRETGDGAAWDARKRIQEAAVQIFTVPMDLTVLHMIFGGFVARLQSLHEGSVEAIRSDNPHAAFTVIRAYFETAAAVLYTTDKPDEAMRMMDVDGHPIKIGKITNNAIQRFQGFARVYQQLSEYSHPAAMGILASHQVAEDGKFTWSSSPRFKSDGDRLVAYAWVIEVAEASRHLLMEFAVAHGLLAPDAEALTPSG